MRLWACEIVVIRVRDCGGISISISISININISISISISISSNSNNSSTITTGSNMNSSQFSILNFKRSQAATQPRGE